MEDDKFDLHKIRKSFIFLYIASILLIATLGNFIKKMPQTLCN